MVWDSLYDYALFPLLSSIKFFFSSIRTQTLGTHHWLYISLHETFWENLSELDARLWKYFYKDTVFGILPVYTTTEQRRCE